MRCTSGPLCKAPMEFHAPLPPDANAPLKITSPTKSTAPALKSASPPRLHQIQKLLNLIYSLMGRMRSREHLLVIRHISSNVRIWWCCRLQSVIWSIIFKILLHQVLIARHPPQPVHHRYQPKLQLQFDIDSGQR